MQGGRWPLPVVLLSLACASPFEPGTGWLEGAWTLSHTYAGEAEHRTDADPSRPVVLRLERDGRAVLVESGRDGLTTRFRARRDRAAAGLPSVLEFDVAVFEATRHGFATRAGDTLRLSPDYGRVCFDCAVLHVLVRQRPPGP